MDDDNIRWITINGQHVPIHEGESKREAVSKFISSKKTRKNKVEEFKKRKQSNSKIKKFVKKGNTFIPVRENEKEKDVVRDYTKANDKETMNRIKDLQYNEKMKQLGIRQSLGEKGEREVTEAQSRRGKLINFTLNNKEQIREWTKDYDKEKVGKKVMNNEPLTMKEYAGYIASNPKEGDIILAGGKNGEDVRVGKKGKLETIKNYVEKKKSNNKIDKSDELLQELKHNQSINKRKKLENRIDIDYLIDRVKDTKTNKEFLEELKYNRNINKTKGLENRVDIDYVIERLKGNKRKDK